MSDILEPVPPPAGYQHPTATGTRRNSGGPGAVLTLVGASAILIGSFLPWFVVYTNYTTTTWPGMNCADGPYMLGIGLIIGAVGVTRTATRVSPVGQVAPILAVAYILCVGAPIWASASPCWNSAPIGVPG
jgi:hypothetical protein